MQLLDQFEGLMNFERWDLTTVLYYAAFANSTTHSVDMPAAIERSGLKPSDRVRHYLNELHGISITQALSLLKIIQTFED